VNLEALDHRLSAAEVAFPAVVRRELIRILELPSDAQRAEEIGQRSVPAPSRSLPSYSWIWRRMRGPVALSWRSYGRDMPEVQEHLARIDGRLNRVEERLTAVELRHESVETIVKEHSHRRGRTSLGCTPRRTPRDTASLAGDKSGLAVLLDAARIDEAGTPPDA
jgi:hypothetical protein